VASGEWFDSTAPHEENKNMKLKKNKPGSAGQKDNEGR